MDTDIYQEFTQAVKEGRQPRCPYCHKPLAVEERWCKVHVWKWDAQAHGYHKEILDEGTTRPCCTQCGGEFNFFINSSKLLCDLGLHY